MKEKICCFSGHRPLKLPWKNDENHVKCLQAKDEMKKEIEYAINQGYTHFIVGMALGSDMYFAECVLSAKSTYPYVTLECAIPCQMQDMEWSAQNKQRYKKILDESDKITYVSKNYNSSCMQKRNKYMVDNSSLLLCMLNSCDKRSGTKSTVEYAKKNGLKVVNIFDNI